MSSNKHIKDEKSPTKKETKLIKTHENPKDINSEVHQSPPVRGEWLEDRVKRVIGDLQAHLSFKISDESDKSIQKDTSSFNKRPISSNVIEKAKEIYRKEIKKNDAYTILDALESQTEFQASDCTKNLAKEYGMEEQLIGAI